MDSGCGRSTQWCTYRTSEQRDNVGCDCEQDERSEHKTLWSAYLALVISKNSLLLGGSHPLLRQLSTLKNRREIVFLPCMHASVCTTCSHTLWETGPQVCPVCKEKLSKKPKHDINNFFTNIMSPPFRATSTTRKFKS